MSFKTKPSDSSLGRKAITESVDQTPSETPFKRVKIDSHSTHQNGFRNSTESDAQQVIKKEERNGSESFNLASSGSAVLADFAAQSDTFESYVSKSIEKCQTQKERAFMIDLLEKEVKNAETGRDWTTWRIPLLPREKLKNLSLALNEDNLQLIRNKADNIIVSRKQETDFKNRQESKRFVNSDSITRPSEEKSNRALAEQKASKLSRFGTVPQPPAPSRFQSSLQAELARTAPPKPPINPLFHNTIPLTVLSEIPIKKREEPVQQPPLLQLQDYNQPDMKSDKQYRKGSKKQLWNDTKWPDSSPINGVASPFQAARIDLSDAPNVVGTCQDLEKKYMRLTDLPNPALIRPKHILEKSLTHVINKFLSGAADHFFVIDQMRSIRHVV